MRITLTGATGFLGLRLLTEFLDRGDEITVLSRMDSQRTVARLRRGLRALGRPEGDLDDELRRVAACQIDLAAEWLGVGADAFRVLADQADQVWHYAAQTALSGAAAKHSINVEGTRRILELAAQGRRRPEVHHISTVHVAGRREAGVALESDLDPSGGFVNHYEESKCRAELMVRAWSQALCRPAAIYRAGGLVSDREVHPGLPLHPLATLTMLVEEVLGPRPADSPPPPLRIPATPGGHLNLLQVEHAARAMAQLSLTARPPAEAVTYHIVHPLDTPAERVARMLEAAAGVRVVFAGPHDPAAWQPAGQPEIAGFLPYLSQRRRYDTRNVRSAGVAIDPPEITTEYLLRGVRWADVPARVK
ncbi:SDR family oxidoreductase [Saccharomonospora sp. NPDC046836]|uniref:SDR family oxidoreductase n=1 Tax=Saccharomonospora sp. NPDC046836 TaxID=3156921 RepID=UPI0033CE71AA